MRAFIAAEIDDAIRAQLSAVRDSGFLQESVVRWVHPDRMHLTLKFLGEIDPDSVADVTKALEHASEGVAPFVLEFASLGFFPDAKRPRVFWAGIEDCDKILKKVHNRLEAELAKLKFEEDRKPFRPHLTLARIKGKLSGSTDLGDRQQMNFGKQTVRALTLFKSVLRPQGPIYTPLSVVTLKESS